MALRNLAMMLANPGFGQGLFQVGQQAGMMPAYGAMNRANQAERQRQQGLQGGLLNLQQTLATQQVTPAQLSAMETGLTQMGATAEQVMAAEKSGMAARQAADEARKTRLINEQDQSLVQYLSKTLRDNEKTALAGALDRVGSLSRLPASLQEQIFINSGMTAEEAQKALSPEGKLSQDMGYLPGTKEFEQHVASLADLKGRRGTPTDSFNIISGIVKNTADLAINNKINQAIVAIENRGAGSTAITEQTIVDIFGSRQRALAALERFSRSDSLYGRLSNSVNKMFRGEITDTTREEYKELIYTAARMQEDAIRSGVQRGARVANVTDENLVEDYTKAYSLPDMAQEWMRRLENPTQSTNDGTPPPPSGFKLDFKN